ncbi:hypothetical protein HDU88_007890 [Geranomyces variabilis]|nr:hypothetical protein HDU88_007890 [Geranomyces variabilis]
MSYAGNTASTTFTFVFTATPPQFKQGGMGSTLLGHPHVLSSTDNATLKAWCEFSSPLPIVSYGFIFTDASNQEDLTGWQTSTVPFISLPYDSSGFLSLTYSAACQATDEAGQVSAVFSFTVGKAIVPGAKAGYVQDGPVSGVEASYTRDAGIFTATFQGFQSANGMPGVLYSWGLGTSSITTDVMPFTSAGLLQPTLDRSGTIFWTGTKLMENQLPKGCSVVISTSTGFRLFAMPPAVGYSLPETSVSYVLTSENETGVNCTAEAANGGLDTIELRAQPWADLAFCARLSGERTGVCAILDDPPSGNVDALFPGDSGFIDPVSQIPAVTGDTVNVWAEERPAWTVQEERPAETAQEAQVLEAQVLEDQAQEAQVQEGQAQEERVQEGQAQEGRAQEGQVQEDQVPEERMPEEQLLEEVVEDCDYIVKIAGVNAPEALDKAAKEALVNSRDFANFARIYATQTLDILSGAMWFAVGMAATGFACIFLPPLFLQLGGASYSSYALSHPCLVPAPWS